MKKSLIALAFGTLALGMTEFVMMGILADVANALGITIPQAGHLVSAYALGVTCGAPLLAVAKQFRGATDKPCGVRTVANPKLLLNGT